MIESGRLQPVVRRGKVLFDRDAELATLTIVVDQLLEARGPTCAIEAAAGMGKTSLLRWLTDFARERGALVMLARASVLEQTVGFGVTEQLVESGRGQARRGLTHPPIDPPPLVPGGDGSGSAFQLMHQLYWWLVGLADTRAVLLVVDDVQWADPPSLRLLNHLSLRLDGLALGVVVARRTDEPDVAQDLLDPLTGGTTFRISPGPLSDRAGRRLVQERLGSASPQLVDACMQLTSGSPFLLTELVGAVARHGVIEDQDATALAAEVGSKALQTTVRRRLDALSPCSRAVAEAAAVLGPECIVQLAGDISGVDSADLGATVDALTAADLLAESEGRLTFVHPLLEVAVYRSLPASRRDQMHSNAAEILVRSGADVRAAGHYLLVRPAGRPEVARRLLAAARQARSDAALDSAALYLRRSLDEPPAAEDLSEVHEMLAYVDLRSSAFASAGHHHREAVATARSADQSARARFGYARFVAASGQREAAASQLEQLVDGDQPLPRGLRAEVLAECVGYLADNVDGAGRWNLAQEKLHQTLAVDPGERWSFTQSVALAYDALAAAKQGRPAQDVADLATRALSQGALDPTMVSFYYAVETLTVAGELDRATAHLDRAYARAEAEGSAAIGAAVNFYYARIALLRGRVSDALAAAEAALATPGARGLAGQLLLGTQLEAYVEQRALDRAETLLAAHPIGAADLRTVQGVRACYGRARVHEAAGRWHEALSDFRRVGVGYRAWEGEGYLDVFWRSGAARALQALGRRNEAVHLARAELSLAESFGAVRPIGVALMTQSLLETEPSRQRSQWERAVEVLSPSYARLEAARAYAGLGAHLLHNGDRRGGARHLRTALDLATSLGAHALADTTSASLARLGGRPPRGAAGEQPTLTPIERQVVALLRQGWTNRAIARETYVTEKAVEYHVANLRKRFGANSRYDLPDLVARSLDGTTT